LAYDKISTDIRLSICARGAEYETDFAGADVPAKIFCEQAFRSDAGAGGVFADVFIGQIGGWNVSSRISAIADSANYRTARFVMTEAWIRWILALVTTLRRPL